MADCATCRSIVAAARSPEDTTIERALAEEPLGRYEIGEELGRGGQSIVWSAYDHILGRCVALKVCTQTDKEHPSYTRFVREAQITARLTHPGIIAIHDVGIRDDGSPYTMRSVQGLSLAQAIASNKDLSELAASEPRAQRVPRDCICPRTRRH